MPRTANQIRDLLVQSDSYLPILKEWEEEWKTRLSQERGKLRLALEDLVKEYGDDPLDIELIVLLDDIAGRPYGRRE